MSAHTSNNQKTINFNPRNETPGDEGLSENNCSVDAFAVTAIPDLATFESDNHGENMAINQAELAFAGVHLRAPSLANPLIVNQTFVKSEAEDRMEKFPETTIKGRRLGEESD